MTVKRICQLIIILCIPFMISNVYALNKKRVKKHTSVVRPLFPGVTCVTLINSIAMTYDHGPIDDINASVSSTCAIKGNLPCNFMMLNTLWKFNLITNQWEIIDQNCRSHSLDCNSSDVVNVGFRGAYSPGNYQYTIDIYSGNCSIWGGLIISKYLDFTVKD